MGHQSHLKTDITGGEAEIDVLFRVTEPRRWPSLMGKELVLQVIAYNDIVIDQSMISSGARQIAFLSCGLLDRKYLLGFQSDSSRLQKLLMGQFSAQGTLGIQVFLEKDVLLPMEDFPSTESNKI